MPAMIARRPTNLYESFSNLKSTGAGNMMDLTSLPLTVQKPVLMTTAKTRWPA